MFSIGVNLDWAFWTERKAKAEAVMDEFDQLDADLRELVRQTNDLTAARGEQQNRRFFESAELPAGERLTRKRR